MSLRQREPGSWLMDIILITIFGAIIVWALCEFVLWRLGL